MNPEAPFPYCGPPATPDDVIWRWNLDPALIVLMGLVMLVHWRVGHHERRMSFFLASWLLVGFVFVSPFCALASALFTARSLHHILLIAFIPPLLLLAAPRLWAGRASTRIVAAASVLHAIVLWAWHAPLAYAWALADTRAYWLMQATLFGTAFVLWRSALGAGAAVAGPAAMAFTFMQTAFLGALLSFSASPLYAFHLTTTGIWGLTPLADQQLAGVLMWTLGGAPYLTAALMGVRHLVEPRAATA